MPPTASCALRKAHRDLDAAVDRLCRRARFPMDRDRVELLFILYGEIFRQHGGESTLPRTGRLNLLVCYEKLADSYEALLHLAAAIIC